MSADSSALSVTVHLTGGWDNTQARDKTNRRDKGAHRFLSLPVLSSLGLGAWAMALSNLCDGGVIAVIDGAPRESIACVPEKRGKCLHISEPLTDHSYHTLGNVSQFDLPLCIRREAGYEKLKSQIWKGAWALFLFSGEIVQTELGGLRSDSTGQRRFVNSGAEICCPV